MVRDDQPDAREGQVGRRGVAERFAVPLKPGNAGGGKGPQFKTDARRGEGPGDWATYQLRRVFRNCRWPREMGVSSVEMGKALSATASVSSNIRIAAATAPCRIVLRAIFDNASSKSCCASPLVFKRDAAPSRSDCVIAKDQPRTCSDRRRHVRCRRQIGLISANLVGQPTTTYTSF